MLFQPGSADEVEANFPGLLPVWNQGLRSFLASPLISHNEVIGVLWISSRSDAAYAERHTELAIRVAAQIAGGVANSQLYEEIQRLLPAGTETRRPVQDDRRGGKTHLLDTGNRRDTGEHRRTPQRMAGI